MTHPVVFVDTETTSSLAPPWSSSALFKALDISQPEEDRHTALGDARMVKAVYEKIMGPAQ